MGHQGMKSSLVSREVIADSVELTMRGHCYDALVGLAGCDKSLPGMMMAMVRLNVPSIFIYGGSILPGSYKGRQITVQDVFEAVGQHSVGTIGDGGHRSGAAIFLRGTGALRDARPLQLRLRRKDHGADRKEYPPARHRHAEGAGECGDRGLGHRRLDQRSAAFAGDRA
jgi:hypothetical protein